ncbi:MAG: HAMP domain-containing protein, partial [Rhodobiaceae bacterium]|nr:HAMP domain-containing protein [Rhodobiaceae bacterium]
IAKNDPVRFKNIFDGQAILRALPGAYLMRGDKTLWLTANTPRSVPFSAPPDTVLPAAENEGVIFASPADRNVVSAIVKLKRFDDIYLVASRPLDPRVLAYLRQTEAGVAEYRNLEEGRGSVQIAFGLMFLGLALILLLSATWIGIGFANRFVSPIRRLISAADRVSEGDLETSVPINKNEGDLANLGKTFNNMTQQLRTQREALLTANKMLDRRRRFTEAVLSGVTAGVIGVDRDGRVTLINRSA